MQNQYYYSLNDYLKRRFGQKVYKLSLNGGMTCPNRDGTIGNNGCIFCSAGGSGDFAADKNLSITEQIEHSKLKIKSKVKDAKYIAYFQAYTNTYATVDYLEKIFTEALTHSDIVALSIATRPDCLPDDVLELIKRLNLLYPIESKDEKSKILYTHKPVWVELGLQTIHEKTATLIRRGYSLKCFEKAVKDLKKCNIEVIVHLIIGLPGETQDQLLESIKYISNLGISGVKLQLLHVLKDTDLALYYEEKKFKTLSMKEYIDLLIVCIEHLPPNVVIHRITGDGPKSILIAPLWSANKKVVLNTINRELSLRNVKQGSKFET